LGNDKVFLFFL